MRKALQLLQRSNPALFEWCSSPIRYRESEFVESLQSVMESYFSPKRALYHYLNMASGHYRAVMRDKMVKGKKYFYVLRPILACLWILTKGTPPPVLFSELVESELLPELRPTMEHLLHLKMNHPEQKMIPRVKELHVYVDSRLEEIEERLRQMSEDKKKGWKELDRLFLSQFS